MRQQRGFTLIELAIVLVIIGIILGMVLKGQDLIQNARMKKFVSKTRHWETYMWIYFDRKGKFAGDDDKNGIIADETTSTSDVKTDLQNANFSNPPDENGNNTITLGSNTFYVFFGNDGGVGTNPVKNIMVICVSNDCTGTFSDEQIEFASTLDVSLDGTADGTAGNVICTNTQPDSAVLASWEATYSANDPTPAACSSGNTRAIVYYFDAKR